MFWIFVTAPLWYMGFDIIPQMVEEAAPTFSLKRLSIIIPLSIGAAAVFYVCVVVATAIVWPWRLAAGGACMTLLAFVLPMSPAAFGWPVEWGILLFWILLGGVLWVGGQAYRTSISEKERRAVLLQGKLEHIA